MTAEREIVKQALKEGREILSSMSLADMRKSCSITEGVIVDKYGDFIGRVLYQGISTVIRLEASKDDSQMETFVDGECNICIWPVNGTATVEYSGLKFEMNKEVPHVVLSGAGYKLTVPSIGTIIFMMIYPRYRGFDDASTIRKGE